MQFHSVWHQRILPVNNWEYSTANIQICKTTYKHRQERPTHYKPLLQVVTIFWQQNLEKEIDRQLLWRHGSFDGAEICERVGLYIQSKLEKILPKSNFGWNRDGGLALIRNLNGQKTDKVRKNIIGVFKDIGFCLEIETNLKEVDFLDVSLNVRNGTYRP